MLGLFATARNFLQGLVITLSNIFAYSARPITEVLEEIALRLGETVDLSWLEGTFIGNLSIMQFLVGDLLFITLILWIVKAFTTAD